MSAEREPIFARLPASLVQALRGYCEAHGKRLMDALEDAITAYLKSHEEGGVESAGQAEEAKRIRAMEEAYERKKRLAFNLRREREKMFASLRESVGPGFSEMREFALKCGLKPDPENPMAPLLETIEPAIKRMLASYRNKPRGFTKNDLADYISFLELFKRELEIRRELEQMRKEKYGNIEIAKQIAEIPNH